MYCRISGSLLKSSTSVYVHSIADIVCFHFPPEGYPSLDNKLLHFAEMATSFPTVQSGNFISFHLRTRFRTANVLRAFFFFRAHETSPLSFSTSSSCRPLLLSFSIPR